MEDQQIVALYHQRSEGAIWETDRKYGPFCRRIAMNILTIREDAEECVNDTYHAAWNRMPPELPASLRAFLGRITRNLSISRFRANRAQKRYQGMEILLSELDECIPAATGVEEMADANRLSQLISSWLDTLAEEECALFVRRYWHGDAVQALAKEWRCTPNQMAQRMRKLRLGLKSYLEKEGVCI